MFNFLSGSLPSGVLPNVPSYPANMPFQPDQLMQPLQSGAPVMDAAAPIAGVGGEVAPRSMGETLKAGANWLLGDNVFGDHPDAASNSGKRNQLAGTMMKAIGDAMQPDQAPVPQAHAPGLSFGQFQGNPVYGAQLPPQLANYTAQFKRF